MPFVDLFRAANISASGLTAERVRLEVTANNIANANSTRTADGGPFRRQDVVFQSVLDGQIRPGGVVAAEIVNDDSPFPVIHNPSHPDADASGNVQLSNVQLPIETVNLVTASRSYEANVKALQAFLQMNEQALAILRG
jgi:flagellar basal-body rod protein FlgC